MSVINNFMMPVFATRVLSNSKKASAGLDTQAITKLKRVKGTPKIKVKHEDYSQYVRIINYVPSKIRQIISEITPMLGNYAKKNNVTIEFREGKLGKKFIESSVNTLIRNGNGNVTKMHDELIVCSEKSDTIRQIYQIVSNLLK